MCVVKFNNVSVLICLKSVCACVRPCVVVWRSGRVYVDGGIVRMDMSVGMSCVWRVACLWCVYVDLVV